MNIIHRQRTGKLEAGSLVYSGFLDDANRRHCFAHPVIEITSKHITVLYRDVPTKLNRAILEGDGQITKRGATTFYLREWRCA